MRVLIAEDEAVIRETVNRTLQALGHQVVAEARTSAEAKALTRACAPDCALVDVRMDGDAGFDATSRIAGARICPVVMIAAHAQEETMREASEAGAFAFVTKPFAETDLAAAVEIATHRFEDMRALEAQIKQMKDRITQQRVIDRAKFLLMETGATEEEAFARMRKASMDTRKPLREVAEAIILSRRIIN